MYISWSRKFKPQSSSQLEKTKQVGSVLVTPWLWFYLPLLAFVLLIRALYMSLSWLWVSGLNLRVNHLVLELCWCCVVVDDRIVMFYSEISFRFDAYTTTRWSLSNIFDTEINDCRIVTSFQLEQGRFSPRVQCICEQGFLTNGGHGLDDLSSSMTVLAKKSELIQRQDRRRICDILARCELNESNLGVLSLVV